MALTQYNRKRRFNRTPEPKGRIKAAKSEQLEFVVQKHNASHLHYDFRLEIKGVLKSWAVPKGPSMNPGDRRLAMMVEDHPFEYRKFEGDIPEGNYGAGQVIIWDKGTYRPRAGSDDPQETLLEEMGNGHMTFVMEGQKLKGEFALIRNKRAGENAWLLIKKGDEFANTSDITELGDSVVSGDRIRSELSEIDLSKAPKVKMPQSVKPMLATLTEQAFDNPAWIYEIKWDGYRAIGGWDGREAQLYSRSGQDFNAKYPAVKEALRQLKKPAIIDGEIVAIDDAGRSQFNLLQRYQKEGGNLVFYVFDILWCDNRDLTGLGLEDRKKVLESIIPQNSIIRFSNHIKGEGKKFFAAASKNKLEGIMAKNSRSLYRPGARTDEWLKIKTHLRQEVIICGFTEPRGSRKYIGALILGVYKDGRLAYVGHANAGSNIRNLKQIHEQLEKLEVAYSPFDHKIHPNAPVHWVKPKLLAEVSFSEWTPDGMMRQPVFKGLRTDKDPKEVRMEKPKESAKPAGTELKFSHLDKVFWPEKGYTKGDLIEYYQTIGKTMLPYLKDRPHSLLRQPNGYSGKSFFQKDVGDMPPDWVKTARIYSDANDEYIHYLVCDSVDSLLYMAQLGCIEINPWNSCLANLDKPDWAVLDLDPEDIGFKDVIKVAQAVKRVTDELKIPAYPKTSGKTGIHIFMPLAAKYTYDQTKQFAEILANLVHERLPDITSLERSPSKRQKKIYIDYLQNRQGQTLAAPYSVRPTKGASVSTPLHWDEVNSKLDPAQFTIKNIFKRLDKTGDLWEPVLGKGVDIAKMLKQIG